MVFKRLGPAGPLAIASVVLPVLSSTVLYTFMGWIAPWLKSLEATGVAAYVVTFGLLAGFAIVPTYAPSMLGGWAFGFWTGYAAAVGGFTIGSIIAYFFCRSLTGRRVTDLIDENPTWAAVHRALLSGGFWKTLGIVTLLRVPPSSPFAATNLVFAATGVPFPIYVIGTLIGMTPRTAAVVALGAQAGPLDLRKGEGWLTLGIWVVVTIVVLGIISAVANAAIQRVTASASAKENGPR